MCFTSNNFLLTTQKAQLVRYNDRYILNDDVISLESKTQDIRFIPAAFHFHYKFNLKTNTQEGVVVSSVIYVCTIDITIKLTELVHSLIAPLLQCKRSF